jgi:hypothetical protein
MPKTAVFFPAIMKLLCEIDFLFPCLISGEFRRTGRTDELERRKGRAVPSDEVGLSEGA